MAIGAIDAQRRSADRLAHLGRLDELLHHLRRQASRSAEADVQEVLDWLRRRIGVDVALVVGAGTVEAATAGFPRDILGPEGPTSLLARLARGSVAAAATQVGEVRLRLEALGPGAPHPVLVVAGPRQVTREAASLISHTGSVLDVLRRVRRADATARGYDRKALQLRFAVFQALMAGDPVLARSMTVGAVPPLLDADRVRVHLLYCGPDNRERIAATYQDARGYHGPGLLVPCPVFNGHLICPIAEDPNAPDATRQAELLRRLVRDNPRYALGISDAHALRATADAYGQAVHALAVARHTPGRVLTYRGRTPLARVLPRPQALAWAAAFLRPLAAAPKTTVDLTRLAVSFHHTGVARLRGVSRNTVTAHVQRVEALLGLDLRDVRSRAALDLALSLADPGDDAAADRRQAPTLDALLRTPAATAWARAFLGPLRDVGRAHTTARTWIEANADAQRTARRLGVSRNTVRSHLRTAERLLNRDLLTTRAGLHDLVHALHALRAIDAIDAIDEPPA
ncbi:helix-turn-helix domain-containing protein [Streptomyces radicis]|uniref:PucR family transcriptional regulator n=1 Tax=Streptomyces radicis TaxID=1750517 RepID=A0A3A9WEC6_9ACTN|nr:helix-turn-helix domain-containing protein [Streptomyces radicis]RKN11388.1 PucR family transcriptional regulator [Streptomyces radicis]RKN26592.1 PucR family transcriptional regulator [Streptomyces radicis]